MGLDCTAFCECKYIGEGSYDHDEDVWRLRDGSELDRTVNYVEVYERLLTEFPASSRGIKAGIYSYEDDINWCAGSYTDYNYWRDDLAKMAGYVIVVDETENPAPSEFPYAVAALLLEAGPFLELIKFSDCEGVIGTEACTKLAKDFRDYDEKARSFRDDLEKKDSRGNHWYLLYQKWREACEYASTGGFVAFGI